MRKNRQINNSRGKCFPWKRNGKGIESSWLRSNYGILALLTVAIASFPVGCSYIMSGGIVQEWIARVREIAEGLGEGCLSLFAGTETLAATGIVENAMNSNLFFLFSAVLYRWTGNMAFAYRVYMLLIQTGTFFAAMLCFRRVFGQREIDLRASVGIMLYMTNPYRIYICYDLANLSQAAAWMLLPLYVYAVYGLLTSDSKMGNLMVATLALAGIGYADIIFFLSLAVITILMSILTRKLFLFVITVNGCVLFSPGLYRLLEYLFMGKFSELGLPLQSIMPKGYHLGQFFSSYVFRDGHPGMGMGMMVSLFVMVWMKFMSKEKVFDKDIRCFTYLALFLTALSLFCFPWDILQRLGGWSVRLISLIGTPAIFWGMAMAVFCIPAAAAVGKIGQCENKLAATAIPLSVILFCTGVCIYQCNMLTYTRLPVE